jgi:putative transposase
VAAKREKPNWGARKIRERLLRPLPHCTIHAVLDRHGLVTHPTRSRTRALGTPLPQSVGSNGLWCTDYKGEFMLSDKRYCYPLTVTDQASRYLLLCEAMESNAEKPAFTAFERLFKERGLPRAITAFPSLRRTGFQSFQALGVVAALWHQHPTNPPRSPTAEGTP